MKNFLSNATCNASSVKLEFIEGRIAKFSNISTATGINGRQNCNTI